MLPTGLRKSLLLAIPMLLQIFNLSCSTSSHVSSKYKELLKRENLSTSNRTVVFILIDGLSIPILAHGLKSGTLPQIQRHFLSQSKTIPVARTTFPSITYPAVGSLLSEKPVSQNGIFGNIIVKDQKKISFESPKNLAKLNEMIKGQNIFSRLKAKGLKTVSLDYSFISDSDIHIQARDVNAGLAILGQDYEFADKKLINSLHSLLTENSIQQWPDFIFIHLIGLDLTAHKYGPKSNAAKAYLSFLDLKLGTVLKALELVEKSGQRQIITLLSSDHGFDKTVEKTLDFENNVKHIDPNITVLNEGRYAAIYFPQNWLFSQKSDFLKSISQIPSIDIVAYRDADSIYVKSHSLETQVSYINEPCADSSFKVSIAMLNNSSQRESSSPTLCPNQLTWVYNKYYYPYFLSNISYYFESPNHPDAILIPKPGIAFTDEYRGQHGGPTPQETFVPLLMRNISISNRQQIPAVWDLLKFL